MASVKFIGEAHGPNQTVAWHGHTFKANEAVETDHADLIRMAKDNPFFEVSGADEEDESEEAGEGSEPKRRGRARRQPSDETQA